MPKNTLIRVVTTKQGKQPRPQWFTFSSLTGEFVGRLYKVHHKLEVEEICIDEKGQQSTIDKVLSSEEYKLLLDHWPSLTPPDFMPPEPEPLKKRDEVMNEVSETITEIAEATGDEKTIKAAKIASGVVDVAKEVAKAVEENEPLSDDYSEWPLESLKDLLELNGVKYDGRKKKPEYFIELIKTNNL